MREGRLLLTWDKKLITVAAKIQGNGWVVSPDTAADFMQAYRPISEVRFRKLAQAIAQVSHQEDEVTARVIDGLVGIAAERNVDWKLDDEIARLKHRVLSGVDFTDPRYQEWVDSELFEYASERTGISVKELKNSTA